MKLGLIALASLAAAASVSGKQHHRHNNHHHNRSHNHHHHHHKEKFEIIEREHEHEGGELKITSEPDKQEGGMEICTHQVITWDYPNCQKLDQVYAMIYGGPHGRHHRGPAVQINVGNATACTGIVNWRVPQHLPEGLYRARVWAFEQNPNIVREEEREYERKRRERHFREKHGRKHRRNHRRHRRSSDESSETDFTSSELSDSELLLFDGSREISHRHHRHLPFGRFLSAQSPWFKITRNINNCQEAGDM